MKAFVPRHIDGNMFNMKLQLWPFNITMIQLFILAAWLWISLVIWNSLTKAWTDKMIAFILVLPIFLIFLVIAFFKISELSLLPFLAKLLRTYFFDEPKKYQLNYKKVDPLEVDKQILRLWDKRNVVYTKKKKINKEEIDKLKWF